MLEVRIDALASTAERARHFGLMFPRAVSRRLRSPG
jgi:hypothetical protein